MINIDECTHNRLLTAKSLLDDITEGYSDGIFITDGEGMGLYINRAITEITTVTEEQIVGRNISDVVAEGILSASSVLEALKTKKRATVLQVTPNKKTVLVSGFPLFDEAGNIRRVVVSTRDITELNHLKNQLEHAQMLNNKYYSELMSLKMSNLSEVKDSIIVNSNAMRKVAELALQVARADSTVLITGESGVGKEVVTRLIHSESLREKGPFIKINSAAIPDTLLESELFGYESGAFSSAKKEGKAGLIELAHNGTLFLDEIGELPLPLQAKMLQVLQDKTFYRIGGTKPRSVNIRIIAATNVPLEEYVAQKRFRGDLYYRLNVVPIAIPPLRERIEDIPPLTHTFLSRMNKKYDMHKTISSDALDLLQSYSWPGNVRELENMIERIFVMTPDNEITSDYLPPTIKRQKNKPGVVLNGVMSLGEAQKEVEKQLLERIYGETQSTYKTAKILGVSQSTVVRKLKNIIK
ncbi:MAG: sigma 54-interacting transcriptional regulator [Sporomusaceae bacterium]|nr:sigma 54-interacting transcriptional regulator [Sporomusaceae bacterium]